MRRDQYSVNPGPENMWEPGSDDRVMSNKLGVTDPEDMDGLEYEALLAVTVLYYTEDLISRNSVITADIIRQMHGDWLGGIYEWAGRWRSVNMTKGSYPFPPAQRIPELMYNMENELLSKHTPCNSKDIHRIANSMAIVHAEFLAIHPFREGNGRLSRWIADIMAAQANMPLPNYGFDDPDPVVSESLSNDYLNAVFEGYTKNYEPLSDFFESALLRGF